ncbi:MAG TPA: hypothetical protein ENK58_03195 [Desulfobacterales bacterium]|nr:MAG: hypothetical protein DRI57_18290 [Deltaproteobacteria bacterium]HHC24408.1 hypothetical protein [Desulfobacterales bacterium]
MAILAKKPVKTELGMVIRAAQTVNALHIIYFLSREKCYGRQSDVFDIADDLMTEKSIGIRSESAIISVYLAKVFDKFPNLNPEYSRLKFILKINEILKIGVSDRAKPLLEKYLTDYDEHLSSLLRLNKMFRQYKELPVTVVETPEAGPHRQTWQQRC